MFRVPITKHFQIVKHPRIMVFFTVQHKYWFLCNLWNYEQYYYYLCSYHQQMHFFITHIQC